MSSANRDDEDAQVAFLTSMLGDGDPEMARRALRKFNGDIDQAATALLEGTPLEDVEKKDDETWPANFEGIHEPTNIVDNIPKPAPRDEDNDMDRALRASLEETGIGQHQGPKFGPSERMPDANWALTVPSNVEQPSGVSQEDRSLNRAIQESLSATWDQGANETLQPKLLEDMIRVDSRPSPLRPSDPSLVYGALVLQALFYIPQVRRRLASWRPTSTGEDDVVPLEESETVPFTVLDMFVNQDIAIINELNADKALEVFGLERSNMPRAPGDLSTNLFRNLAHSIESALHKEEATLSHKWPRLFHFRYGSAESEPKTTPFDIRLDQAVVQVEIHDDEQSADLVSCLSHQLSRTDQPANHHVIFEPSDVVTFSLVRHETLPSYSAGPTPPKRPFRYPKYLYLDQFLKENVALANAKRAEQREMRESIQRLEKYKAGLTSNKGKDVLKDLRSAVHYYENVAHKKDAERKAMVEETGRKLRKISTRLENELESIDNQIAKFKKGFEEVLEGSELKQHRYDLRVVLVHDGQYGRNHLYSYVHDLGKWWSTVDNVVEEVSEDTVLNDKSGLHFGAGPYMLIYSRALSAEEEAGPLPWPDVLKDRVKHNNAKLRSELPFEVVAGLPAGSPMSSPYATPSSSLQGAASPSEEPMDTTS